MRSGSYCAIAWHVGHTDVKVAQYWKQWAPTKCCSDHPRQTTPREDQRIVSQASQNPITIARLHLQSIIEHILDGGIGTSVIIDLGTLMPQR